MFKKYKNCQKIITSNTKKDVFYESNESSGMNSIIEMEKKITNKRYISSITLDKFCKDKKISPDIIKVDIEGLKLRC